MTRLLTVHLPFRLESRSSKRFLSRQQSSTTSVPVARCFAIHTASPIESTLASHLMPLSVSSFSSFLLLRPGFSLVSMRSMMSYEPGCMMKQSDTCEAS